MRILNTVYSIYGERCRIIENGVEVRRFLSARWVEPRADSEQVRREVLKMLGEQIHAVDLLRDGVSVMVLSVVSQQFAGETEIELGPEKKPVPSGRAHVRLDVKINDQSDIDPCFDFETRLDEELQKLGVGHVDGNDIGGGQFRLFCYGPRKKPLHDAVQNFAESELKLQWRIGTRRGL